MFENLPAEPDVHSPRDGSIRDKNQNLSAQEESNMIMNHFSDLCTVTDGEHSSRQRLAPLLSSLTLSQLIPDLPEVPAQSPMWRNVCVLLLYRSAKLSFSKRSSWTFPKRCIIQIKERN